MNDNKQSYHLHYYAFNKRMDSSLHECNLNKSYDKEFVDLTPYINVASLTVQENCPLARIYELFRCLGLRHLTVLDKNHYVVGIITRKDLMNKYKHRYDHHHE